MVDRFLFFNMWLSLDERRTLAVVNERSATTIDSGRSRVVVVHIRPLKHLKTL